MKHVLCSLPLFCVASTVLAHEAPHLHHHMTDPGWAGLVVGALVISCAAGLAWRRT